MGDRHRHRRRRLALVGRRGCLRNRLALDLFLETLAIVLALAIAAGGVKDNLCPQTTRAHADWRGLALFSAAIALLVIGLLRTTTSLGGWAQSGVLACFGCSGLLLLAFVAVEAVSPAPVLDLTLFRDRTFTGSSIAAFGLAMSVLGPIVCLVVYLSYGLGYSTLAVGTHLLLLSGMTLPLIVLARYLDRLVPLRLLFFSGLVMVAAGCWLLTRLPVTPDLHALAPGLIVVGIGMEMVNPRLASAAAAPFELRRAAASRASSTFRYLGTAVGIAVLGSVLATRFDDELSNALAALGQLSNHGPQIANLVLEGRTSVAVGAAPPGADLTVLYDVQKSFADALHEVFLVAAVVALASSLLALLVRSRDTRFEGRRGQLTRPNRLVLLELQEANTEVPKTKVRMTDVRKRDVRKSGVVVPLSDYPDELQPVLVPVPVAVPASGRHDPSLELAAVGRSHLYGAVRGPDGCWVPGVLLTLAASSGAVMARATTDDAGSYFFPRVPEGSYVLIAPASNRATRVDIGPAASVATDLVLSPAGSDPCSKEWADNETSGPLPNGP